MKTTKLNLKKITITKLSDNQLSLLKGGDGHVLGPKRKTKNANDCQGNGNDDL